ncbi:hypothetical protein HanPI659440_Chr17g0667341 [Helianthus annuus]|nr:hypothetical protein HanPI659440_Chr17g0667341 [Helianthus annuus]
MSEIWFASKLVIILGGQASFTKNLYCQRMVRKSNLWLQSQCLMICILSRKKVVQTGVWRSNMSLEIMEHPHQAIYIYVVLAALRRLSPLHL